MHSCSNPQCSHTAPRSTKYHTCPLCSSKLVYICINCKGSFFSSNSKHKKNCTKISITEQDVTKYLYGKHKIIMKRKHEKICIAFFNNGKIKYAKERKKFGTFQMKTKSTRKEKVKHLHNVNNVPSIAVVSHFTTIFDKFDILFYFL